MSFFTPADAAYIKGSIQKIKNFSYTEGYHRGKGLMTGVHEIKEERDAEHARLEAFIDGCTLEKGKA